MKTITCGECRHFVVSEDHGGCCTFICDAMCDDDRACYMFQKPTTGDKIRQMSNERLAVFVCGLLNDRREETFLSVLGLLNAPAGKDINALARESEGQ